MRRLLCWLGLHDWARDPSVMPVALPPRGVVQLYDHVCLRCGKWSRAATEYRARQQARRERLERLREEA